MPRSPGRRLVLRTILSAVLPIVSGFMAASAQEPQRVVVGLAPTTAFAPLYVAIERGYIAEEGLSLDLGQFRGAGDAIVPLGAGQIDALFGGITAGYFNSIQRGLKAPIVAAMGIQPRPTTIIPLVVRKDLWDSGAVRSGADLRGRSIAVATPGSSGEAKLSIILAKDGLSLKDVEVKFLSFPAMVVALQNRAIDLAIPAEPFASAIMRQGSAVMMPAESAIGAGDLTTVLIYSEQFLRDRPEAGIRLVRALLRAVPALLGDRWREPEVLDILAKYTNVKQADIAACAFSDFDADLDASKYLPTIAAQEAQHLKNGRLQYTAPLDPNAYLNPAILGQARSRLR